MLAVVDHAVDQGFGGTRFSGVAGYAEVEMAVEIADGDGGVGDLFLFDAHEPPAEGTLGTEEDDEGGEADAFFEPFTLGAVEHSDGKGGAEEEADGEFVEGVKNDRGEEADEDAANGSAERHGNVEAS